jgi:predicted dehydrogenase
MKTLLIGAGPMAVAYARVLRALGVAFDVIGRGDRSAGMFFEAVGQHPIERGLAAYLSAYPLNPGTPVIVALPVTQLANSTCALIAAGARRLLVEKPGGLNLNEIDKVTSKARVADAQVFVAYNRRFYASVLAVRKAIAEDGGVSSFHMEFTEGADRVATPGRDDALLANWLLANSSHVIDLAFHLAGEPTELSGAIAGGLPWHPAGAVFAGHGRTAEGALFTWHADWNSAGRWALDVRTPKRRLILQPLEKLFIQEKSSFAINECDLGDRLDVDYKPGVYRQVEAFLSAMPSNSALPTIAAHAHAVRCWFGPVTARPLEAGIRAAE